MKIPQNGVAFMLVLGALAALPPLSIDMALPALTRIAQALDTRADLAGLTLSLFMAGFAVSPLVYGPLADRFGRRPVLLAGLALFVGGAVSATAAPTIMVLLAARLVQGAGAGAGMTLAFAIVRDLFTGREARTRLAVITIVANLAPVIAPALGAALLPLMGWRGIYAVMTGFGLMLSVVIWVGFAETLTVAPGRSAGAVRRLARGYQAVLTNRAAVAHILINGLGFGWLFAYVAGSPLVLLGVLHVSPALYAGLFACTGAGIVAGAGLNGQLTRWGATSGALLSGAIGLAVADTVALLVLTQAGETRLAVLMPLLVVATLCFGLAAPSATHGALDPLPEQAGIAGGLLTSVQMAYGAAASSAVALLFARFGMEAMMGTMAAAAIGALVVRVLLVPGAVIGQAVRRPG